MRADLEFTQTAGGVHRLGGFHSHHQAGVSRPSPGSFQCRTRPICIFEAPPENQHCPLISKGASMCAFLVTHSPKRVKREFAKWRARPAAHLAGEHLLDFALGGKALASKRRWSLLRIEGVERLPPWFFRQVFTRNRGGTDDYCMLVSYLETRRGWSRTPFHGACTTASFAYHGACPAS